MTTRSSRAVFAAGAVLAATFGAGCRGREACTATSCGADAVCTLGTCERDAHVAVSTGAKRLVTHPSAERVFGAHAGAASIEIGGADASGTVFAWEFAPALERAPSIESAYLVVELADGFEAPSEAVRVELREITASQPLPDLRPPFVLGRPWAQATLEAPMGRAVRLDVTEAVKIATSHGRWPLRWALVATTSTATGASVWTSRELRGPYLDVYVR